MRATQAVVLLLIAAMLALAGCSTQAVSNLDTPEMRDRAMQLIASAEVSSLNWRARTDYIEDIQDGRGYTAGAIGFCSGTGDMLSLILYYTELSPGNVLAKYIPALEAIMQLPEKERHTHAGLDPEPGGSGPNLVADWQLAAKDPVFHQAYDYEWNRLYFQPAVTQAKEDGLGALGQFIYFDSAVMHGFIGSMNVRDVALQTAKPPSQGGDAAAYLNTYLDARVAEMDKEDAHSDFSRVENAQRWFLRDGNLDLKLPLRWKTYGDSYFIDPR